MIFTETEADAKRCCGPHASCKGPGCAAWRWWDSSPVGTGMGARRGVSRRGYCGLAGKPEKE